jgi:integrase
MIAMDNAGNALSEFLESVYLPQRLIGAADGTLIQYRHAVRQCGRVMGRMSLAAIDERWLAAFTQRRVDEGCKPPTVNKELRVLRAILRLAAKRGAIAAVPDVSFLREELEEPLAFLVEEYGLILESARAETGTIGGLAAADWWESFLLAGWDTGARLGALLAARPRDLDLDAATLYLRAGTQKQGRGQRLHLHASTVAVCRRVWDADREIMWPWPWARGYLYRRFRRILVAAGVETFDGTGSLFHRIRKATASYVSAAGGNPTLQLGHSCESVTRRYLDPRICQPNAVELIPRPGRPGTST